MKKTISVKQFISELGEDFSEHMKERLLDLNLRSVLTRKEDYNKVDIKHVEHTMYGSNEDKEQKEYSYGQLIVDDGVLYFSEKAMENDYVMQAPVVSTIYSSLGNETTTMDEGVNAKKVDDTNIDYVVDTILGVCPEVSQSYLDIVKEMTSRSDIKAKSNSNSKSYI
ncbi:hypothetical protein N4T77_12720 [Clostridium sp. CX1]|uniref:Uncharacterized protein n=1 Tax=Clostridium tanneri TaxID=3037988 RepID=A0ABU4JQV5_9CLOT|nr:MULTISPECIES: hypothetical protein [unclassified Clostridium]MCT8977467.1 hypothetical protein [Clostridium sp. CX1]MDW8800505.1 hypothetical protein [Clostridium sp. A1-XYC3]